MSVFITGHQGHVCLVPFEALKMCVHVWRDKHSWDSSAALSILFIGSKLCLKQNYLVHYNSVCGRELKHMTINDVGWTMGLRMHCLFFYFLISVGLFRYSGPFRHWFFLDKDSVYTRWVISHLELFSYYYKAFIYSSQRKTLLYRRFALH